MKWEAWVGSYRVTSKQYHKLRLGIVYGSGNGELVAISLVIIIYQSIAHQHDSKLQTSQKT
jgi:hypothetical protein